MVEQGILNCRQVTQLRRIAMSQGFPRFCPRCGAATVFNQRLCVKCGFDLVPALSPQSSQPPSQPGYSPSQPGLQPSLKPVSQPGFQPYASPVSQPGFSQEAFSQPSRPTQNPVSQPGWGPPSQQPFPQQAQGNAPFSEPPSTSDRSSKGRVRLILVLLLVLLVLAGGSFAALGIFGRGSAAQSAVTSSAINTVVTYAGVMMTVQKVEQAQNFTDDPNSAANGMLRVHLQAQNTTQIPVNLMYNTIARLVVPGGKTLSPTYVKANVGVAPGVTRTAILDFAVPTDTKAHLCVLQLGAPDEAQLDIPLMPGANMSRYAPVTSHITGATFQYLGLNCSLLSATSQLSIDGKQASKGMHYVGVTLMVNNTLSQTAIPGSAFAYMRLKAGSTTATPVETTLPVSFDAGANGKTGTVTFLAPQNATTYTLILLAQPQSGFDQVTQDFRLS